MDNDRIILLQSLHNKEHIIRKACLVKWFTGAEPKKALKDYHFIEIKVGL